MKLAVLGASGRSGIAFVSAALEARHEVYAGVRSKNSLPQHDNLHIVSCDVTKLDDVLKLITGCDAVISLIGHVKNSPADMQTVAIQNVIQATQQTGVKRVVTLTGTGVRFPGDDITLIDRFLNFGVSTVDPKRVNDGLKHAQILQATELDWTILRVLKLQNTKPKPYVLRENGPTKVIVSRSEVASAILEILADETWVRKAPIIGNR